MGDQERHQPCSGGSAFRLPQRREPGTRGPISTRRTGATEAPFREREPVGRDGRRPGPERTGRSSSVWYSALDRRGCWDLGFTLNGASDRARAVQILQSVAGSRPQVAGAARSICLPAPPAAAGNPVTLTVDGFRRFWCRSDRLPVQSSLVPLRTTRLASRVDQHLGNKPHPHGSLYPLGLRLPENPACGQVTPPGLTYARDVQSALAERLG